MSISDDKKILIISTTALNRPPLHKDIFPNWIKWIKPICDDYDIHWFINIDIIKNLPYTYENTVFELRELIKTFDEDMNITFHLSKCDGEQGDFLKACKRLSLNIDNFIQDNIQEIDKEDIKIIWLEDDWKLHLNIIIPIEIILQNYSTQMSCVNLTFIRPNYIHALAPCIIAYPLWKKLHYNAWISQTSSMDPEHCVGVYYKNNFEDPLKTYNLTVINKVVNDTYFDQPFLNCLNSYYTFHKDGEECDDKRYVNKNEIKNKFNKDINLFVRISPTACGDGCGYGRKFLEENGIFKNKNFNGKNHNDFYILK